MFSFSITRYLKAKPSKPVNKCNFIDVCIIVKNAEKDSAPVVSPRHFYTTLGLDVTIYSA